MDTSLQLLRSALSLFSAVLHVVLGLLRLRRPTGAHVIAVRQSLSYPFLIVYLLASLLSFPFGPSPVLLSSFVICVNLLHPQPSLFLYGLLLSHWCFSILVNCYFQLVSFNLKVILFVARITQMIVFSARERAEFNKSCNLIGSWSGRNFLIRTSTAGGIRRVDLFS